MTDSVQRPWSIIVACVLGIGMSLFNIGVLLFHPESSLIVLLTVGWFDILLIGILILAFLGRDYGRNLLLIFVGSWVLIEFGSLIAPVSVFSFDDYGAMDWASISIFLFVVVLLFVPASNQWYRRNDAY